MPVPCWGCTGLAAVQVYSVGHVTVLLRTTATTAEFTAGCLPVCLLGLPKTPFQAKEQMLRELADGSSPFVLSQQVSTAPAIDAGCESTIFHSTLGLSNSTALADDQMNFL